MCGSPTSPGATLDARLATPVNLLPQPSTGQLSNTESWGRSTINDGDTLASTITLTPVAGSTATGLQVRHLTVACGNPALNQPACEPIPANTPAHARVAGVTLTLDDPSAPGATISSVSGGWTNAGSVSVTATGQDPQSGISRLALWVKRGSSTKRPVVGTWNQDTTGGSIPGWATTRSGTSTVSLPRTGTVTISTVARNGAQTEATSAPTTVRIDRNDPKVTWPRKLEGGQSATVRDAESGLASLSAAVDGRSVSTTCATGAKQCKVKIPTTANGTLRIRATDQAGNDVASERKVTPRPRGGGGGSGAGGGSGRPKRPKGPSGKPGSRKPGGSYCSKHPNARTCKRDQPNGPVLGRRPRLAGCTGGTPRLTDAQAQGLQADLQRRAQAIGTLSMAEQRILGRDARRLGCSGRATDLSAVQAVLDAIVVAASDGPEIIAAEGDVVSQASVDDPSAAAERAVGAPAGTARAATRKKAPAACTRDTASKQMATILNITFRRERGPSPGNPFGTDTQYGGFQLNIADGWCRKNGRPILVDPKRASSLTAFDSKAKGRLIGTSSKPEYNGRFGSRLRDAIYSLDCKEGGERSEEWSLSAGFRGLEFGLGNKGLFKYPASCSKQGHRLTVKTGYSGDKPPRLLTPYVYFPITNGPRIRFTDSSKVQGVTNPDGRDRDMATTPRGECTSSNAESGGVCRPR